MWEFNIQTDRQIKVGRPNLVAVDKRNRKFQTFYFTATNGEKISMRGIRKQ